MGFMDSKEMKFIMGNITPFDKLGRARLNKLLGICEVNKYENREIIYSQGDAPDYFYIILTGRVEALVKENLRNPKIEILKRGTCFGIISLFTNEPHSVTMRSIETTFVLQAEKDKFKEFLKRNPLIFLDLSRILSQRVKVRFKPKRIFQSKKIGVTGAFRAGRLKYISDLGVELKEQTKKNIICIKTILETEKFLNIGDGGIDSMDNVLSMKFFREEEVSAYIVRDEIDYLYISPDGSSNFLSLLNFLSESYHFIIYESPYDFLKEEVCKSLESSYSLHFLLFSQNQEIEKAELMMEGLKNGNLLVEEKIKLILCEDLEQDKVCVNKEKMLVKYPIYATLPCPESDYYSKALTRIARDVGEVSVGIAFGSGAAYGFSHIGVLKVLERNGIDIDIVCGSSTGAMIAAMWAAGFDIKDIEEFAKDFGKKISSFSIMGFSFPFKGLMRAKRLESIFKGIFKDLTFYDLKHTLKIVAFDFIKRKTVILTKGPLYKAVAASCAMPGIFEPIRFNQDILLDGGILNPLPVKILLQYDTSKIIACNITLSQEQAFRHYSGKGKIHIFDFIFGSIETMQQQFVQQALKVADVVIHPNLEGLGWMEFEKASEFIKRGEIAALEKINEIKSLVFS